MTYGTEKGRRNHDYAAITLALFLLVGPNNISVLRLSEATIIPCYDKISTT